jgi:hypothetical protein
MAWASSHERMIVRRPATKLLFFLTAAGLVGSVGLAFDTLLMRGGMPRSGIMLLSNFITGAIAGTLFVHTKIREQENREIVQDRLRKVADMNHHVRNALAVVAFYGTQNGNTAAAQRVSEAVKRIEWTLREILPKGWDLRPSTPSSPVTKRAPTLPCQCSHSRIPFLATRWFISLLECVASFFRHRAAVCGRQASVLKPTIKRRYIS